MIFPIYAENKNTLTSLKGEVGSFFKVESDDLETLRDLDLFYDQLEKKLLSFESKDTFRFYFLGTETYLYSNGSVLDKCC